MCVFFFFKQKTAYEMRISDWSSDVCSSDLSVERMRQCLDARGVGAQKLFQRGRLPLQSRLERLRYAGRLAAEGSGHVVETLACPVGHVADRLGLRLDGLAQALRRLVSLMAQRSEEHTSELQSLMRH